MAYNVVIKVKYGDMLRRFNANIVDGELDLSIDGLRAKIVSLFSFPPETEPMLTYVDEDGDTVGLLDADDLLDAVKQGLNPLRITVKLNSEKNARDFNLSSGSSAPFRSPWVQQSSQNQSPIISEILKSVPKPLQEAILKLSSDLAAKTSYSAPAIRDLADYIEKVDLSFSSILSEPQTRSQPSTNSDVPQSGMATTETRVSDLSNAAAAALKVLPDNGEKGSSKCNETSAKPEATKENNKLKPVNVIEGIMEKPSKKALGVDAMPSTLDSGNTNLSKNDSIPTELEVNKPTETHLCPKTANVSAPDSIKGDYLDGKRSMILGGFGRCPGSVLEPNPHNWNFPGPLSCPSFSDVSQYDEILAGSTSAASFCPASQAALLWRSSSRNNDNGIIFHRGIRCDVCGVYPITGPRFKSKVKVDYDLCSICFAETGNNTDYIRMDHPAVIRQHLPLKELHDSSWLPVPPQVSGRGLKIKSCTPKLDSRFVQDVNVIDGTVVAPLTAFTKIWRMRNNGMIVWPMKTQIVWIGGDKLSDRFSIELEIPEAGLPVDQELDIAVDFVAPERPGRYISYWRLATPSGQKFGQRVWVLIQVDASVKDIPRESVRSLNLNLPPASSDLTGPVPVNVDGELIAEDSYFEPGNKKTVELASATWLPNNEQEMKFPINDSLVVGTGASSSVPVADPSNLYTSTNMVNSPPLLAAPVASAPESAADLPGENIVEEKLLRELEEMGFETVDLNKDILRSNDYDFEKSVDDLCGVAEWDPILEELQEMGFHDTEMNKKLLKKNNGSIMRVVMNLLEGEKN